MTQIKMQDLHFKIFLSQLKTQTHEFYQRF